MFLYYDEEPARRSPAAEIWRDCARRAVIWTGVYAVLAAAIIVMSALGVLDWHLTVR